MASCDLLLLSSKGCQLCLLLPRSQMLCSVCSRGLNICSVQSWERDGVVKLCVGAQQQAMGNWNIRDKQVKNPQQLYNLIAHSLQRLEMYEGMLFLPLELEIIFGRICTSRFTARAFLLRDILSSSEGGGTIPPEDAMPCFKGLMVQVSCTAWENIMATHSEKLCASVLRIHAGEGGILWSAWPYFQNSRGPLALYHVYMGEPSTSQNLIRKGIGGRSVQRLQKPAQEKWWCREWEVLLEPFLNHVLFFLKTLV